MHSCLLPRPFPCHGGYQELLKIIDELAEYVPILVMLGKDHNQNG